MAPYSNERSAAWSPASIALVALGFLFILSVSLRQLAHQDLWGHLAYGQALAAQGLSDNDLLSFTAKDQPWVAATWLYDRLAHGLWRAGGPVLIVLGHAAALAGAFVLLLPIARRWARPGAIAAALGVAGWVLAPGYTASPAVLTLLYAAVVLRVLYEKRPLWVYGAVLLPLQILWVQTADGIGLAPVLVLIAAFTRAGGLRAPGQKNAYAAWLLAPALLAVCLLNPYGFQRLVAEYRYWFRPDEAIFLVGAMPYAHLYPLLPLSRFALVALALAASGLVTQKMKLPPLLTGSALLGAVVLLRYAGQRSGFFALLGFPFLAMSLELLGQAMSPRDGTRHAEPAERPPRPWGAYALFVALALSTLAFVTSFYYRHGAPGLAFGAGVAEDLYPQAAKELYALENFPERVLNFPADGGYLAWAGGANRRVFVDARRSLYGMDFFNLFNRYLSNEKAVIPAFDSRWNPQAALFDLGWPGAASTLRFMLERETWVLAYFDGTTALLLRPARATAKPIVPPELRAQGLKKIEDASQALTRDLAAGGTATVPPRLLGAASFFSAMGRTRQAAALYGQIVRARPHLASARLSYGAELVQLGRAKEAVAVLEPAARSMKDNLAFWFWMEKAYRGAGQPKEAERAARLVKELTAKEGSREPAAAAEAAADKKP